jgi:L-threonylcarbamoyladenylate synthase
LHLGRIAASPAARRGSTTSQATSRFAPSTRIAAMATAAPSSGPQPLATALRLAADDAGIATAGAMLRAGRCVAFPTETVYGLGANALDEAAVRSVFDFKGRPLNDPLIVHLPSPQAALSYLLLPPAVSGVWRWAVRQAPAAWCCVQVDSHADGHCLRTSTHSDAYAALRTHRPPFSQARTVAEGLAARFWPGPLTLVGRAVPAIPLAVTAGTGFVGVRVPAHPIAARLLAAAGVPVAAPSANRFGHVSPTTADHVAADLGRCPIGIVDGEAGVASSSSGGSGAGATCAVGIESTVVKVDYAGDDGGGSSGSDATAVDADALHRVRLVVYRRGGVSVPQLERALAEIAAERGLPAGEASAAIPLEFVTLHKATPAPHHAPPAAAATAATPGEGAAAAAPAGAVSEQGEQGEGCEAPGMLLTHYAPDVDTYLVTWCGGGSGGDSANGADADPAPLFSAELLRHAVVIDMGGALAGLRHSALAYDDIALPPDGATTGSSSAAVGSLLAARARLFAALRWSEGVPGARAVLLADPALLLARAATTPGAAPVEGAEHADALRDRMFRAASGRTVSVEAGTGDGAGEPS